MRAKSSSAKKPAEQVVKDIRRATRRHFADSEVIAPTIPRNSRPGFRSDPAHRSD